MIQPSKSVSPIDDAVQDLLKVIGDIEFQLGLQNIESENFGLAVTHFKLGTTHHHVGATFNLGICYELGIGVAQDMKLALECYRVASAMGHAKAMYNVGIFYGRGLGGLTKSRRVARQYFEAAAKLGLVDAQRALGRKVDDAAAAETVAIKETTTSTNRAGSVESTAAKLYLPQSNMFQAVAVA